MLILGFRFSVTMVWLPCEFYVTQSMQISTHCVSFHAHFSWFLVTSGKFVLPSTGTWRSTPASLTEFLHYLQPSSANSKHVDTHRRSSTLQLQPRTTNVTFETALQFANVSATKPERPADFCAHLLRQSLECRLVLETKSPNTWRRGIPR